MALYGYVLVEAVISVPFNEMSTCENRLCRNRLTGLKAASARRFVPSSAVTLAFTYSMVFPKSMLSSPVPLMSNSIGEPSQLSSWGGIRPNCPVPCLSESAGRKTNPIRTLCTRTTFREQTTSWSSSSLHDALLLKAETRLTTHALRGSFYTFRHALFGRLF